MKVSRIQSGAALITALVIVFVIAILGTAIGQQVVSLRKNSTYDYDQTMSFSNADSAVSEGGAIILENAYTASSALGTLASTQRSSSTWWADSTEWTSAVTAGEAVILTYDDGNTLEGAPMYVIEDMGSVCGNLEVTCSVPSRRFYRVTGKAAGKGEATTYIQANYAIWE